MQRLPSLFFPWILSLGSTMEVVCPGVAWHWGSLACRILEEEVWTTCNTLQCLLCNCWGLNQTACQAIRFRKSKYKMHWLLRPIKGTEILAFKVCLGVKIWSTDEGWRQMLLAGLLGSSFNVSKGKSQKNPLFCQRERLLAIRSVQKDKPSQFVKTVNIFFKS